MSCVSCVGNNSSPLGFVKPLQHGKNNQGAPGIGEPKALAEALSALGIDPDQAASIQGQIKKAVKNAVRNAGPTDNRQVVVQQAVDGVLKQNGIDPAQFRAQLQAVLERLGGANHLHRLANIPKDQTAQQPDLSGFGDATGTAPRLNTLA